MATKLYVGRLPYSTTNEQLEELFAAHGKVDSARIIIDRDTNQSKGFGFVEMADDQEAVAAIAALNNSQVDGRSIVVNEAKPMESKGPRNDRPRY